MGEVGTVGEGNTRFYIRRVGGQADGDVPS